MRSALRRLAGLTAVILVCSAHVGSPDAWYDGPAGPWHVLVHVQAPPVVPGIAIVNVRVVDAGASEVTAYVNRFDATGGHPPPDVAQPVSDNPGWYRTQLWVMTSGSNAVNIAVRGTRGTGSAVVPLTAVAGRRLTFSVPLAILLAAALVFLASGMFTIVGAAVRESVLPPGAEPDHERRRRARFAMARAGAVFVLAMSGTAAWWRSADRDFTRNLYRPLTVSARIATDSGQTQVLFTITDSAWMHHGERVRPRGTTERGGLVEDHGKLVHLFLISEDGRSTLVHLHPVTIDTVTFTSVIPPVPAGNYRVFADIVHSSGMTETLTSSVTVSDGSTAGNHVATTQWLATDSADSWATRVEAADGRRDRLADGTGVEWLGAGQQAVAEEEADLRFVVRAPGGSAARLEPFLGMAGHAVVVRDDGKVFIHLHPLGTISMAAQSRLGAPASDVQTMSGRDMTMPAAVSDTLYFPYAFPQPGRYTVWVQFKRAGHIQTANFPVSVAARAR